MKKRRWSSSWSFYSFLVLLCCHGSFAENIPKTQHAKDVHVPATESKNHNVVNKEEESSSSQTESSGGIGEEIPSAQPDVVINKLEDLNVNIELESSTNLPTASLVESELLPQVNDDAGLATSVNSKNVDIKDNIPSVLERLTTRQCAPLSPQVSITDDDVVSAKEDVMEHSDVSRSHGESIEDKLSAKFSRVLIRAAKGADETGSATADGSVAQAAHEISTEGELGKAAESERPVGEGALLEASARDGASASVATPEGSGSSVPTTEDMPSFNEWAAKKRLEEQVKNGLNLPSVASQQVKVTTKQKMRHKNYASMDCGAKVLTANSEAQSTSAVLSQNRDDYMLNPCTAKIWLVIELCESIQADRIELANYELFSSTPREFSVYSSDRYPSREWTLLGKFEAKDERTVQSFSLEHNQFGKFIKVELVSHYGSEHFCLLSLVRVYGTSEYEALDTDDAEASGVGPVSVEEEDDELGSDSSQDSQNLFGSAKDAVMNIVKKYTDALRSDKNGVAPSDTVPIIQAGSNGGTISPKQLDKCFCMQRVTGAGCESSNVESVPDGRRSSLTKNFLLCHYPELLDILQRNGDLHLGMCGSVCHILTEDEDDVQSGGIVGHRTHRSTCGFHLAVFGPVKFGALCRLHALLLEEQRGMPPADRPRCTFGNLTVKPSLLTMDQAGTTLKTGVFQAEMPASTSSAVSVTATYDGMCADLGICTTSSSGVQQTASIALPAPVSSASVIADSDSTTSDQRPHISPTKTISENAPQVSCLEKDSEGRCRAVGDGSQQGKMDQPPLEHTAGRWPSVDDPPSLRVPPPVVDGSPRYPPIVAESPMMPVPLEPSRSGIERLSDSSERQFLSPNVGDAGVAIHSNIEGTLQVLGSPSTSAVDQSSSTSGGALFSANVEIVAQREENFQLNDDELADEDRRILVDAGAGESVSVEVVPTAVPDPLFTVASATLSQQQDYSNGGGGASNAGIVERQPSTTGPGVPVLPATGMAPGQKESVFVRLSNRIKALELNMSLSSQYLEELSRRYRKQMEEMQRAFNKTIGALNESARLTHERDINQQKVIEVLQGQLANITLVVDDLQAKQEGHVSHVIIQIVAQGLILVVLFLACSRPNHQQTYRDRQRMGAVVAPPLSLPKSRNPSPTDSRTKPVSAATVRRRRNSDTSVVKHKRPSSIKAETAPQRLIKDSRRPSSEALNVSGTYSDLLIIEPTMPIWMDKFAQHRAIDPPKKKKNRNKGKTELGRSLSNRVMTNSANSIDAHRAHPKASRKSSLASESSAGLLFGAWEGRGPLRVQDLPPPSGPPGRRATDAGMSGLGRRSVTSAQSLLPLSAMNGYFHGRHSPPLFTAANGHERTNGTCASATSLINGCLPDLNPIATFRAPSQQNQTIVNGVRKGSVQKVYG